MEGRWPSDDLRRAFVEGAKWWEFKSTKFTMWPSDVDEAEKEAERRFPEGRRKMITVVVKMTDGRFIEIGDVPEADRPHIPALVVQRLTEKGISTY